MPLKRVCTHAECDSAPTVRVRGGVPAGYRGVHVGWSGDYCFEHALGCVELQLFQVPQDMPIHITKLPSIRDV